MNKSVSQYQQYWELLKKNRNKWLLLEVPDEYHARVIKALSKRKWREHATTAKHYPPLDFIRNPAHALTKQPQPNMLLVRLPYNMVDTI